MWANLKNYSDAALLVLRVTFSALVMVLKGWPILAGGLPVWRQFAVKQLGITLWPAVWGISAALAETIGCALIIAGFLCRPAALLLFLVFGFMSFVDVRHTGWGAAVHSLELMAVYFALFFLGAGRYSVDKN